MDATQINRAADIYHIWQSDGTNGKNYEVPELYRSVSIAEIEENDWALTPSKYIEFIDHDLEIDYEKARSYETGEEIPANAGRRI